MRVNGEIRKTIWIDEKYPNAISIIDQRNLPHEFNIERLHTVEDVLTAITDMHVRGAGLIGVAAAYGMWLAALQVQREGQSPPGFNFYAEQIMACRPTAVNLVWAVNKQMESLKTWHSYEHTIKLTRAVADKIAIEDELCCFNIGVYGSKLIEDISRSKKEEVVNILTHCNAGWLAFVDWGSALAPVYKAHNAGIKVHVWVDETRPRNQGARLTAWELEQHGVPFTIIADNTGGHLMQKGLVDIVIVGTDRTTHTGFVANKIGTYLKALAAKDNDIPFYVALPESTFDWETEDGDKIEIEERGPGEVTHIRGLSMSGQITMIRLVSKKAAAVNYAFDVTPPRLITGLITNRGICEPNMNDIMRLFPEKLDC